jgi:type I restriction enzyme, S subunit
MTPEGWVVAPVQDLFEIQLGKMLNKLASTTRPRFPYLGNREVQWGRFDLRDLREMHFSEDERRKFSLRPNDLLVCEGGEVGRTSLWRRDFECYFQKALHRLRPLDGRVVAEYMLHFMRFAAATGRLSDYTSQSSIAHLTREKLAQLEILLPPVGEQRKIAAILSSVDHAIETTQAVINQLQVVKKAMMAELLTRGLPGLHTRFKQTEIGDVPEEWDVVFVGQVASSIVPGRNKPQVFDRDIPWITIPDLRTSRVDRSVQGLQVSREQVLASGGKTVPQGTVLMTCVGRFGITAVAERELMMNQQLHGFVCGPRLVPMFLCLALQIAAGQMRSAAGQTTIPYVNKAKCEAIVLPLPPLDEQAAIARAIEAVEHKVFAEVEVSAGLSSLKSCLMSVLLTGELRVTPDEAAA